MVAHTFTKQVEKMLSARKLIATVIWDRIGKAC
jgi:hypothetical protein